MNIKKLKMPKRMRVSSLGGSKLRGMKVARSIRKINVADKLKSFRKRSSGGAGEDGGSRLGIRRKSKKFLAMVKKNLMSRPKLGGHRGSKRNNSKNIIIIHNNTSITSNDEDNRSSCVEVKEIASLKEEDVTSIDSAPPTSSDSVLPPQDDQESLKEEQVVESDSESESESESDSGFVEEDDFGIISFREDKASIHIQSVFRAHLARRAFRALKSLVKLQAVVRGVCVRRQARIALHCINTLARLQLKVQARQLRGGPNHAVAA